MKIDFMVPFDTDVDLIRKIAKRINKDISADEELGPKLLDKVKSQGVKAMADSGMMIRLKFKSRPGEQFVLRKEVLKRLRDAFEEKGLTFAHRRVTVHVPTESPGAGNQDGTVGAAAEAALSDTGVQKQPA